MSPPAGSLVGRYAALLPTLAEACRRAYGEALVSLAVFGSVGRGTPRPGSDIDLLLVVEDLPTGRPARSDGFLPVEEAMLDHLAEAEGPDFPPVLLSPVVRTPDEIRHGSPLLFDLVEDAHIVHDRDDFLRGQLDDLDRRLQSLGARRIWRGSAWFWDLKPDYRPGEVFEI